MSQSVRNRVREQRERWGLAQVALAKSAQITRQSLSAIEAGRATPAVDVALRISGALQCPVEQLFGAEEEPLGLDVELADRKPTSRLALALVRDRWIGLSLSGDQLTSAADAVVTHRRGSRARAIPLRPLTEARENVTLMGCATGLGLLADRLCSHRGVGRFLWVPSSSGAALRALAQGTTHLAGVHSAQDGPGNVEAVRRSGSKEALVLVTLARWEAGLLTRDDDQRVRGVSDLPDPRLRLVAREKGAGARQLLEQRLRQAGASLDLVRNAPLVASGHLDVARAISMGAADVGLATRDAALAFGLRFLPLAEECYDLVIPRDLLGDTRVERLLDTLVSRAGRRDLESLGYDVRQTGTRVAEVEAA